MEPTILISIIGIIAFTLIMRHMYNYANGKSKVSESKKANYINWVNRYGKTLENGIIIISIIYGIGMLTQILSLI